MVSPFARVIHGWAIFDTALLPFIRDARGGSYGKRNRSILSGDAYSLHVDHSSRSVCDRPPARREISPLNLIATKPQRQRQTKSRSRRFLLQSKFGYPHQQIRQPVSRQNHPPISNPARDGNVAHRKHGSRRDHRAILIPTLRTPNPSIVTVSDLRCDLVAFFSP